MAKGGFLPSKDGSLAHLIQPKWKSGATKVIRVPVVLADQLLAIAHLFDERHSFDLLQDITGNSEQEISDLHSEISSLREEIDFLRGKLENAVEICGAALKLKANSGGAIKAEIKKAFPELDNKILGARSVASADQMPVDDGDR